MVGTRVLTGLLFVSGTLATAVADGCSRNGPGSLTPRSLQGCYALFGSDGRPVSHPRYYRAGPRVRLGAPRESRAGAMFLLTLDSAGILREVRRGIWFVAGGDSLELQVPGMTVTEFVFALQQNPRDTLRGRAETMWDVGPHTDDLGAVSAVRIACGATTPTRP